MDIRVHTRRNRLNSDPTEPWICPSPDGHLEGQDPVRATCLMFCMLPEFPDTLTLPDTSGEQDQRFP